MTQSRKDLTAAYKQMKFRIGVFQIRSLADGKIYVGSSVNLDAMWNRLRVELNFGTFANAALQQDWKQHGEAGFAYEVLAEIEQKDGETTDYAKEAKALEALYLEDLKPYGERGYHQVPK
jgi:hypothetical protein